MDIIWEVIKMVNIKKLNKMFEMLKEVMEKRGFNVDWLFEAEVKMYDSGNVYIKIVSGEEIEINTIASLFSMFSIKKVEENEKSND